MSVQADALRLPLGDETVDLVCTSPPYFALRSYRDGDEHFDGQLGSEATPGEFLDALIAATREMVRVLKPSGSIFLNLGDKYAGSGGHNNDGISSKSTLRGGGGPKYPTGKIKATRRSAPDRYNQASDGIPAKSLMLLPHRYAIRCVDELGLIVRQDNVWHKLNGLPESVTDRTRRSHEYIFHFTKQRRYFAAMDEIREEHLTKESPNAKRGPSGQNRGTATGRTHDDGSPVSNFNQLPTGRLPGSVWSIPSEPLKVPPEFVEHFAAFPSEIPRRCIEGWCPKGGVVADPFGGTGTTAMVARALGRIGLSFDLSMDYAKLARYRIYESGDWAKLFGAKPKREASGQRDLFDQDLPDVETTRSELL